VIPSPYGWVGKKGLRRGKIIGGRDRKDIFVARRVKVEKKKVTSP